LKPCNRCGELKPDEDYATDRAREDGLALICRDCNKAKCKEWYQENRARAIARSLAYKEAHGRAPSPAGEPVRRERAAIRNREIEEAQSELHLIRFSESEWMFCLLQGERLGLKAEDYVRFLVKDAKSNEEKEKEKEETREPT
jgi:hypothetical protein